MTAPSINGYEDKLHDTFAVPIKSALIRRMKDVRKLHVLGLTVPLPLLGRADEMIE